MKHRDKISLLMKYQSIHNIAINILNISNSNEELNATLIIYQNSFHIFGIF